MKRWYPALILLCLLLAGCSGKGEETTFPTQTEAVPVEAAPPAGLHDPSDPVEVRYGDALRAYPLSAANVAGMKAMGSDLLVFSDTEVSTRITRLSGEELYIAATAQLDFGLTPDNPSLQVTENGLSYFDPVNRQTVVLDASLREITHIPVPEDLEGTPLLSRDRETLYYCTKAGVRAWNLETGIRRVIKEAGFAQQSVTGLHLNDTVLQCRVADNEGNASTLLLSTESGRILYEGAQELTMRSRGDSYFISFPTGCTRALLFGQAGEEAPLALTPAELSGEDFLLETFADAVTASVASDTEIKLDYYDLETGRRRSSVTLPFFGLPLTVEESADGWVYFLLYNNDGRPVIYRWDTAALEFAVSDTEVYTGPYYSNQEPDYHGLVWCEYYARSIGDTYGVEVLLWEDANLVQPWDYNFETEYLVPVSNGSWTG